ncbi:MAG: FtsX-like permease family protein [Candidatus Bathyarchaeia archaeon]
MGFLRKIGFKKFLLIADFSLLSLILLLLICQAELSYAADGQKIRVYGFVVDSSNNRALCGAKIGMISRAWVGGRITEQQIIVAETDSLGFFEIYVDGFRDYIFFAYYDDTSTPGVDYISAYKSVLVRDQPQYINFSLFPSASINLTGDPFFSPEENAFLLEVKDEDGMLGNLGLTIQVYESRFILRDSRFVFVPADINVKIEVSIFREIGRGPAMRIASFIIPDGEYLNLKRGEQATLDLKLYRLKSEAYINLPSFIEYVKALADKIGVLSNYERVKISNAEGLLMRARAYIDQGDYVSAQADLYESFLILADTRDSLISMFQNSAFSTIFVTLLIGFSSSALGAIMFRNRFKRFLTSLIIYIILALALYYMYPGYIFVQDPDYNPMVRMVGKSAVVPVLLVSSFAVGFILINAPYNYGERSDRRTLSIRSAIIAAFSIATENLKRRKFRTILVTSIILISVAAFISLTSFSHERGFMSDKIRKKAPSQGIFLFQQSNNSEVYPFGPVESYVLDWLSKNDKIRLMSILLKNFPQVSPSPYVPPQPLGNIINPYLSLSYSVLGVIGLKPSLETEIIKINQIIDEGNGRFLEDNDLNGILISEEASKSLNVKLGDKIVFCGMNFTVIGIFNSAKLKEVIDLDGNPVLPKEIFVTSMDGQLIYTPRYVAPENVVILVSETASRLPLKIVVSRVNIQTHKVEDMLPLARALTLTFERVETFVSFGDEIIHFYIGDRFVSYGFTEMLVLLILTSLNIGVTMLNSVYERRREIVTLSTVGLNPSQISAIFVAEALIIAFITGSLGYLLGLTGYYVFFSLSLSTLVVKYKVEAAWGVLALFFSIFSSMIGALLPSLKASIIATPSLLRRFMIPREVEEKEECCVEIPIKIIDSKELLDFIRFIEARLREYSKPSCIEERVDYVKLEGDESNPESLRIKFYYKYGSSNVNTRNNLFITKDKRGTYVINLSIRSLLPAKRINVWQTAAFIRRLTLEYTEREKIKI